MVQMLKSTKDFEFFGGATLAPVRVACVRGSGESPERRLNGRKLTPRRQGLAREGWSIGSLW